MSQPILNLYLLNIPLSKVMQVIQEDHLIYPEHGAQPNFVSENTGKLKRMKEMLSRSTCLYCLINLCKGVSHKGCHIFNVRIILIELIRLVLELHLYIYSNFWDWISILMKRHSLASVHISLKSLKDFEDFNYYFSTIFKKE